MAESRKSARMARLVAQWRTSGESGASFARRHQLSPWAFWYWCRKLKTDRTNAPPPAPRFLPLQIATDRSDAVMAIVLRDGGRVEVRAGASPELVRAAVQALRASC